MPLSHAYLVLGVATPDNPRGPESDLGGSEQQIDILTYFGDMRANYALEPNEDMHRVVTIRPLVMKNHLARVDLIVQSEKIRCWSTTVVIPVKNTRSHIKNE